MDTKILIGLMVGVLVAFQLIPTIISSVSSGTTLYTVNTEWHNNTATGILQVAHYPVQENSETLKAYNGTTYVGTLVKDTNYTVTDYNEGKFNITDLGALSSANISVDYQWHTESYLSSPGERAIATLVTLFVLLGAVFTTGKATGMI